MEKLEKVELVREKTGASYQDAKEALEACEYDVLDAIVWLEEQGKATKAVADDATGVNSNEVPTEKRGEGKIKAGWKKFCNKVRELCGAGMETPFIVERGGEDVASVPLLFVICGLLLCGASIWILLIGLFFGLRYRIDSPATVTIDVNEAMDKAADAIESIKA